MLKIDSGISSIPLIQEDDSGCLLQIAYTAKKISFDKAKETYLTDIIKIMLATSEESLNVQLMNV